MKLPQFLRSKSRKVNGYVKAELRRRLLARGLNAAHVDMVERKNALTGGQLAESTWLLEIADPDPRQLKLKEEK